MILELTADKTDIRLDAFISSQNSDYTRSYFSNLIAEGKVTVNGAVAKKAGLKLREYISFHSPNILFRLQR